MSLSHMCRAAQVKFNKGLQHNTCRTYHGEQQTFWTFSAQYQLTAFPASEDTLMVFVTYLDDHLQRCYATIHYYMVVICVAHIALGLPSPLENCPHLHQLLWAICHYQPSPSQTQAYMALPWSSFTGPGIYTRSTMPRTACYGQP